jgi:hypothetical protein
MMVEVDVVTVGQVQRLRGNGVWVLIVDLVRVAARACSR